ncbi:MAG TPA: CapA family protein [Anaerolineae bacterium]|nr:CapA family protein [Anaerolineae bacterium]
MKTTSNTATALLWALSIVLMLAGASLALLGVQGGATAPATPAFMPGLVSQAADGASHSPLATPTNPAQPAAGSSAALPPAAAPALAIALLDPLPSDLGDPILRWIAQQPGARVVTDTQQADIWISTEPGEELLAERIYVPVGRFATLLDEVSAIDLLALWLGTPEPGAPSLAVDGDAFAALSLLWGPPAQVEVLKDTAAVAAALEPYPARLGVLPFDRLAPQVKALAMGGQDPTDNGFDAGEYPLAVRFYLNAKPEAQQAAADLLMAVDQAGRQTNRDPSKLTVLAMTGVTAMARMTALRMEQKGYDYPAVEVGPVLSKADITHISNEIPFMQGCQVNPNENNLLLCSKPEYLEALRLVGVDIVGLTGNHLNDFGKDANLWSLQFYQDEELPTYGGGANLEESLQPLLVEHNGNRLVFLGANQFGPEFAWAAADWPGSTPYDLTQMTQAIADARSEQDADLVLAELQWEESYDTLPIQSQRQGLQAISSAGADIVTGVQSHVPQAVEFGEGGLILYGLGNFFFDQMWSQSTREGLIPRHTIYDGRHLSTKLLTTVLEDFAQPRWATEAERQALLRRVFTASGW